MLKILKPYMSKYKWPSILASITVIVEVLLEIQIPLMMSRIVDEGVANSDMGIIYRLGGTMIGLAVLSLIFGALSGTFAARGGIGFGAELRKGLFDRIQSFSFSNIDNFSPSSLITRLTSDITNVQMAYMTVIRVMVRAPVMLIAAAIMASSINSELVEIFIISIPLLSVALFLLMRFAHPRFKFMLDRTDNLNRSVQENLIGMRVVKAFNRQDYEKEKFEDANSSLMKALLRAQTLLISIFPVMMLVMNGTILAIVWFGGLMIIRGVFLTGELISFITYCTQILMSLMMIGQSIMMLTISFSSLTRIKEVFDEPLDITNTHAQEQLTVPNGSVSFRNVYFKYNDSAEKYILDDINLDIKSGETIGIIGGTGSSKSSLVQLIPRLYDASQGEVYVGGHKVDQYTVDHLRDSVGMVLQNNVLFSGTIAENLRWGNEEATDAELIQACKDASIDDFIDSLPDGLNTDLSQGGVNLSGGQKQRLCIARALLKKPKIIILDDSTSAVDMTTDKNIRESFKKNLKDMTTFIIAQRIASVEESDRIIVMNKGKVDAFDTPANLEKTNKIYQTIKSSQSTIGNIAQIPVDEEIIDVTMDELEEVPSNKTASDNKFDNDDIEIAEIVEDEMPNLKLQEGAI